MIPAMVLSEAEKAGTQYLYGQGNALYSVNPPESLFGYTVWGNLIPPFRPAHTLILGYGGGTVAALMRKIWGQCKVTGVDMEAQNWKYTEYKMKVMDAKDFLKDATTPAFKDYLFTKDKFDYVCIDLWEGQKVCDFVFDVEFAVRLREIATGLVSMNVLASDVPRLKNFNDYGYQFDRTVPCEKNQVVWWSVVKDKK
jgi:SAM-dependent methyltransferase